MPFGVVQVLLNLKWTLIYLVVIDVGVPSLICPNPAERPDRLTRRVESYWQTVVLYWPACEGHIVMLVVGGRVAEAARAQPALARYLLGSISISNAIGHSGRDCLATRQVMIFHGLVMIY